MGVGIKFYNWKAEQDYAKKHSRADTRNSFPPKVGEDWLYYAHIPDSETTWVLESTKGKITKVDVNNGVVLTDAGEILMRG